MGQRPAGFANVGEEGGVLVARERVRHYHELGPYQEFLRKIDVEAQVAAQ